MSSTDAAKLRAFFEKRLVPAAEALRARGVRFMPMGPDQDASTWYAAGPTDESEFLTLDDLEACERALHDLWQRQQLPELVALVGPLMELARRLEVREEDLGDIDPFVYVMY